MPHSFTLDMANRMLPLVSKIVRDILDHYRTWQQTVEAFEMATALSRADRPSADADQLQRKAQELAQQIQGFLAELTNLGAEFKGFEAQGRFRIMEKGGDLDLKLKADYVEAKDTGSGRPLPRISPLRLGAGLEYRLNQWGAGLDVEHSAQQNRVSANELPTDAFTLVNANLIYRFKSVGVNWDAFLRANNLLNQEARNHVSFVKDVAPMPGRGVLVGLRGLF